MGEPTTRGRVGVPRGAIHVLRGAISDPYRRWPGPGSSAVMALLRLPEASRTPRQPQQPTRRPIIFETRGPWGSRGSSKGGREASEPLVIEHASSRP
jgi:hypothetical protein